MSDGFSDDVRNWVSNLEIPGLLDGADDHWRRLDEHPETVVTLFGAYDTGKSALLRRLISDAGLSVPDWLTISARHETFELNEAEAYGCLLRDTPGISTGTDSRSVANTSAAFSAIGATDVALLVLTPQGATAERQDLLSITRSRWREGGLLVVISRFDEAGVDPESDLEGYRELGDRKASEIAKSLSLPREAQVFVVCQDYAALAGALRNPEPSIWDESRGWDGMRELETALAGLSGRRLSLRAEARYRYWIGVLQETTAQVGGQLEKLLLSKQAAEQSVERWEAWRQDLEELADAAHARLDEITEESTLSAMRSGISNPEWIRTEMQSAISGWWAEQNRELDKLREAIAAVLERQRDRPSWEQMAHLWQQMADIRAEGSHDDDPSQGAQRGSVSDRVADIGPSLIRQLRALVEEKSRVEITKIPNGLLAKGPANEGNIPKAPPANLERLGTALQAIEIGLPAAIEALILVEEIRAERTREEARLKQQLAAESQARRVAKAASELAFGQWYEGVESSRTAITRAMEAPIALSESLGVQVDLLQQALARAEDLAAVTEEGESR